MLNIALIGYGYWGPNLARNIAANPNLNLYGICDKRPERLKKARELYGSQPLFIEDYSSLLSDPSIDAVAVAVETESHYNVGRDVLLAGKHLFMEKPLTDSLQTAISLKELAESKNLVLQVDHIMIFHPIIRRIKGLIDAGEIGEILYIDSSRINLGRIKSDVSAMWDLAVHDLAVIDYLSGGQAPEYISVLGQKSYSPKETLTYLTMSYGSFIAHLKSSWISPLKERKMVIAGSKKMIVFDDVKVVEKLMIFDKGIEPSVNQLGQEYGAYEVKVRTGDLVVPYVPHEDSLYNSLEHFRDCILSGHEPICSSDQALRVIDTLERADKLLSTQNK